MANHEEEMYEFDLPAAFEELPVNNIEQHPSTFTVETTSRKSFQAGNPAHVPSPYTRRERFKLSAEEGTPQSVGSAETVSIGFGGERQISKEAMRRKYGIHSASGERSLLQRGLDIFRTKKASGVVAIGAESVTVSKKFTSEELKGVVEE